MTQQIAGLDPDGKQKVSRAMTLTESRRSQGPGLGRKAEGLKGQDSDGKQKV